MGTITTFPGDVTITEAQLITAGLFDPAVSIVGLVDGGLASVSDLVAGGLLDNEIDLEELILLNLVTGQQLVDGGIITQGQLDSESFVGPYLVPLLATSVAFGDGAGPLVMAPEGFGEKTAAHCPCNDRKDGIQLKYAVSP